MGRPPLPLGTSGKVLFATLPNGRVKARVKFRDYDGRVRLVSKVGPSRAAAERALKAELTGRQAPGGVGARLGRCRRPAKSFENTTTSAAGWLQVTRIATTLRHLSHERDRQRRVAVAA